MTGRAELLEELIADDVLRPVIEVNGCGFCAVPRGTRTRSYYCHRCMELHDRHGEVLDSLESIAFSRDDEPLLALVREWKSWVGQDRSASYRHAVKTQGLPLAAILSAYLEAHFDELGLTVALHEV
jgi:hypothetical protein